MAKTITSDLRCQNSTILCLCRRALHRSNQPVESKPDLLASIQYSSFLLHCPLPLAVKWTLREHSVFFSLSSLFFRTVRQDR